MKDRLTDANFPRTADNRVYHLGLKPGEIANRILTVGSASRARLIATHLDESPKQFRLESERGFQTITGRYKGIPISIVSIGMGAPNMDFFVRETRESIMGDMAIVRLGSCGSLNHISAPVGTVVVPKACVSITRNVDFDFGNIGAKDSVEKAYFVSKPVEDSAELHQLVVKCLEHARLSDQTSILGDVVNASADSFYSSQGRVTAFPDHNTDLLEELLQRVESLGTLEMETHHLYHLAKCWNRRPTSSSSASTSAGPPLTTGPVQHVITSVGSSPAFQPRVGTGSGTTWVADAIADSKIYVSAAQMVFAARTSVNRDFITPENVKAIEEWGGKGVLEALIAFDIPVERLHPEEASVWALP